MGLLNILIIRIFLGEPAKIYHPVSLPSSQILARLDYPGLNPFLSGLRAYLAALNTHSHSVVNNLAASNLVTNPYACQTAFGAIVAMFATAETSAAVVT